MVKELGSSETTSDGIFTSILDCLYRVVKNEGLLPNTMNEVLID
jgi:hypothetical protein